MNERIWNDRSNLLWQVFRLPDVLPKGFCFGGGRPCNFQMVDWYDNSDQVSDEQHLEFAREKAYYKQGGNFLLIRNDGKTLFIGQNQPTTYQQEQQ